MPIGNLNVGVKYDKASLRKAAEDIKKEMNVVGSEVENSLGKKISGAIDLAVFDKLRQGIVTVGQGVLTLAGNLEQARIAFSTMLGSAEKADTLLRDLTEFAKNTPFELTGIRETAKQLLAYGIEANKIIPTLKSLGDVSAGLSVPIQQVAYAYGQVRSAGRLLGTELRQFLNAGVPIIAELSKNLGIAEGDVRKFVEAGKIGFADVEKAFITMSSEGGKFANLMDAQSQTLQGAWSNLKDSVASLGEAFGGLFIPAMTELARAITPVVEGLKAFVEENPQLAKTIGIVVASLAGLLTLLTGLNGAIGLFGGGLRLLTPIMTSLGLTTTAVLGPLGILLGLMGLLTVAYAKNTFGIQDLIDEMRGISVESKVIAKAMKEHKATVDELTKSQEALKKEYLAGKVTKEEYEKKSESLDRKLRVEYETLNRLKSGYEGTAEAEHTASDAKERFESLKIDPSVTVNALRLEAQEAINAANAFIKMAQAKAVALRGQLGITGDGKLRKASSGDIASQSSLENSGLKVQYLDTLGDINREMANIAQYEKDIKNAQSIVAKARAGASGGGGGAKKEIDKWKESMDNLEDSYKDFQKTQDDLASKTKSFTDKVKDYYRGLKEGMNDVLGKLKELKSEYGDNIDKEEKSFLRSQAERTVELTKSTKELKDKIKELRENNGDNGNDKEIKEASDKILANDKEIEQINKNLKESKFTQLEISQELGRANASQAQQEYQDFRDKTSALTEQYEKEKSFLEKQKQIYEYFENNKFDTTLGLEKALKDERLMGLDEESRKLFERLATERIDLERQKNEKIAMEGDVAQATIGLANDVKALQINNINDLKAEYRTLIAEINNAIAAQQRLNASRSSRGFASGGYTGDGPTNGVAGNVHYGEYVVNNDMIKNNPGMVGMLEAMRGNLDQSRKIEVGTLNVGRTSEAYDFLEKSLWRM